MKRKNLRLCTIAGKDFVKALAGTAVIVIHVLVGILILGRPNDDMPRWLAACSMLWCFLMVIIGFTLSVTALLNVSTIFAKMFSLEEDLIVNKHTVSTMNPSGGEEPVFEEYLVGERMGDIPVASRDFSRTDLGEKVYVVGFEPSRVLTQPENKHEPEFRVFPASKYDAEKLMRKCKIVQEDDEEVAQDVSET